MITAGASGEEWRNQSRFHDCRQYSAESSPRFDFPEGQSPSGADRSAARPGILPGEFEIDLSLDTPIDSRTSAAGDPVVATIGNPILLNSQVIVPGGSLLHGRILHLGLGSVSPYVDLRFTSIEVNGAQIDISGRRNVLLHSATSRRLSGVIVGASGLLHLRRGFKFILRSYAD